MYRLIAHTEGYQEIKGECASLDRCRHKFVECLRANTWPKGCEVIAEDTETNARYWLNTGEWQFVPAVVVLA